MVYDEDWAELIDDFVEETDAITTTLPTSDNDIPTINSLIAVNAAHVRQVMARSGFVEHGQGTLGHNRKPETLQTSLYRLSTMLVWTFQYHHHDLVTPGLDHRSCRLPSMWDAWFVDLVNSNAVLLQLVLSIHVMFGNLILKIWVTCTVCKVIDRLCDKRSTHSISQHLLSTIKHERKLHR